MANTDQNSTVSSEPSDPAVKQLESPRNAVQVNNQLTSSNDSIGAVSSGLDSETLDSKGSPAISLNNILNSRPTLVQLGSTAAPQPKKYSAFNINKKFLEKNSTSSPTVPAPSSSNSAKAGARPSLQSSSTSHPRLVTTKLTATAQISPSPGPGWSRPASATPPAPNGTSSTQSASTSVPAAPQLPHAGKVIQPQPRSLGLGQTVQRDGGHAPVAAAVVPGKPAWGNNNATASTARADARVQSDFPTAAEVAQGRKPKVPREKEPEPEIVETNKQARMEEADTFRGVHLDPNAHHWDDMEEDDDNFLDGVIEFGDGRQYKIDTNVDPVTSVSSPTRDSSREPISRTEEGVELVADDFDRSWPRTRGSSTAPSDLGHSRANNASPSTSHSANSPLETSRVLFNERSNRLEPYTSRDLNRPAQNSDSRFKPAPGDGFYRGRGLSGANEKQKERDGLRRDVPPMAHQTTQHLALRSPRGGPGSSPTSSSFNRDPPPDHRGRRLSNMGPPPVPPHAASRTSTFKDNTRQLPPHLTHPPSPSPTFERRQLSQESRYPRPPSSAGRSSVRNPSESPVLSHTVAAVVASPILTTISAPQLSATELDEVKKDLMQNAAARAKQRRQQEEEEREKEKERARRKAAELEARLSAEKIEKEKTEEQETESPVVAEIKDVKVPATIEADSSAHIKSAHPVAGANHLSFGKPPLHRLSSVKTPSALPPPQDTSRPAFARKNPSFSLPTPATPSGTEDSWRAKSQLSQPPPPTRESVLERPRAMSFATPPPSALDQVQSESFADFEVVDYSDLAKFIGVQEKADEELTVSVTQELTTPAKSQGPLASDEGTPPAIIGTQTETETWRKMRTSSSGPLPRDKESPSETLPISALQSIVPELVVSAPSKQASIDQDPVLVLAAPVVLPLPTSPSVARRNQYKEAAMSALDDAMSRIKGALEVMHEQEHKSSPELEHSPKRASTRSLVPSSPLPSKTDRWVPPALRERSEPRPQEMFSITRPDPPASPKAAWSTFIVNLPATSIAREPILNKQLVLYNKSQLIRWSDTLSFVPPVEGMSRRTLSLNDVLFPRQYSYGSPKGKVKLPKKANVFSQSLPFRTTNTGAFGRVTTADEASTWRKLTQSAKEIEFSVGPDEGKDSRLGITSRSPPLQPDHISSPRKGEETETIESDDASSAPLLRSRSQPKMPAGSGVAFYRNARVVNSESGLQPSVSFFATNELEIQSKASPEDAQTIPSVQDLLPIAASTSQSSTSSIVKPSPLKSSPSTSQYGLPSLIHSGKTESKSSEDSTDRIPITPPAHHNPPWARSSLALTAKDSPVRVPDPEHLKAVWSQTSNQPGLHTVNSLDGITDDLPSVSFTLQDVKSEDGETPPPMTTGTPSRMSLHDVTRAFQQVPSSSNIASHRPTISPPSTTAPVARPTQTTTYNYHPPSVQPPNQNIRPQYAYPSPMMSHSPAPSPMYSHPNPMSPMSNRMQVNGHTPLYSPVWMPLQNPNPQSSPMMRPMSSSYPTPPIMPYPSPGAPQPMYPMPPPPPHHNLPLPQQQQQNGTSTRGRTVSMMSPVGSHAVPAMPMYPGSPVMMPVHAGRGGVAPGRNDVPPLSTLPQHQQHPHPHQQHQHPVMSQAHHHQSQPYVPTSSYTGGSRPTW